MARKATRSSGNLWEKHKHYVVPSLVGGVIAWFFSGDFMLGVLVFIAVWVGNWIGYSMLRKK
ncbi:MAG: hypothetical protein HYV40_06770 [Candidatus Levybacteria bacterium]|nr:hypothetical protein [Candidatus Levybacteria bacterium]